MKIIERVEFIDVLNAFNQEHSTDDKSIEGDTNSWARQNLCNANSKFQGKWAFAKLSRKDILSIMLPWHASEGGKIELVPADKVGLTVGEAAKKVALASDYKSESPKCWERIQYFFGKNYSPVFLSVDAPSSITPEYKNMPEPERRFMHLDGLHRLIAWTIEGRFSLARYLFNKRLTAYIAGL